MVGQAARVWGGVACLLVGFLAVHGSRALWAEEDVPASRREELPPSAVLRLGSAGLRMRSFVEQVGFLSDGETVVSTGGLELCCWKVEDGSLQRRSSGYFFMGAFSPDHALFLSAGPRSLELIEIETEQVLSRLMPPGEGQPCQVSLSNDGRVIAAASRRLDEDGHQGGVLMVWGSRGDKELWSESIATGEIQVIALSTDGKSLAVASGDEVGLWNVDTGRRTRSWMVEEARSLAFSPDGRWLAVGRSYEPATLLDTVDIGKSLALEDKPAARGPVAFSPDGAKLATGGKEGEVVVWDARTGRELARCERHDSPVFCVAFSPDGKTVASGSSDQTVRLWNAETGAELIPHAGHSGSICGVVYSADGKRILSCDYRTSVRVWDARDGTEIQRLEGRGAVAISQDGERIACGGPDNMLQVLEAASGRLEARLDAGAQGVNIGVLRFSPDGRSLLINDGGGNLDVWDIARGTCREWVPRFHEAVTGVAFTPDGKRCMLGTKDGPLACFRWDTEEREWQVEEASGAEAVAVSPDGRVAAVLLVKGEGRSFSVRWYSVRDGRLLGAIEPDATRDRSWTSDDEYRLEFAANGRVLVAMDPRGVLRLYELATGRLMCSFPRETTQAFGFAVSPSAAHAATGESDGTVLVWNLLALDDSSAGLGVGDCLRDLSSPDAAVAYRAMCRLRELGTEAVERIAKDIDPAAPAVKPLEALVQELDHTEAGTRELATDALRQAGESARACLEACLADTPTAEARERARQILDDLDAGRIRDMEGLRGIRAVWVLECLGSPEARAVLERLAAGAPGARLTLEAAAALRRME